MGPEVSTDLDLLNIQDAWISPDSDWHPVGRWGHEGFGLGLGMGWQEMKAAGWIKIIEDDWRWCYDENTQPQLDAICDWHGATPR